MELNTKQVDDSELNKDLFSGLARDIDIAYNFNWILFFHGELSNSEYSDKLFRYLYSIREDFIKKAKELNLEGLNYDEKRKKYISFYDQHLERYLTDDDKPHDKIYKVSTMIESIILIQMTYTSLVNKDYYISLWFYDGYKSTLSRLNLYYGFNDDELKDKGWHRSDRGSTIYQRENIEAGKDLLSKVLTYDKDKILSKSDIAEIIRDTLNELYKNNEQRKNLIPSERQIKDDWLNVPVLNSRTKSGRPSKAIADKKPILKADIKKKLIK